MKHKGIGYTHLAVLFFGLAGVIGKAVTLPAILVTLGRVFFSSIALFLFMVCTKEEISLQRKKDYGLMFCGGVIMAVHWWSFMQSIQSASVAIGTVTFSTFPLFLSFLEPMIYREPFRPSSLVTSALLLFGVGLMVPFGTENTLVLWGILWGMVSSFTYAVLSLLNRDLSSRYTGRKVCFYQQGFACLVLLPTLLFVSVTPTVGDIVGIFLLGILCTAVAHSLFVTGLGLIPAQTAGIISGMESVYAVIMAAILLGQLPTLGEVMGGMVVLGVTIYTSRKELE